MLCIDRSGKTIQAVSSSLKSDNTSQHRDTIDRSLLSRADEIEKGIKDVLSLMSEKKISRISEVATAVEVKLENTRASLTSTKHKVMLSDKLAELGGGEIIMNYLHFLREQGLEVDVVSACYIQVLHMLWNATDDSLKLSVALAENGLFELLKKQLTALKVKFATNKVITII